MRTVFFEKYFTFLVNHYEKKTGSFIIIRPYLNRMR